MSFDPEDHLGAIDSMIYRKDVKANNHKKVELWTQIARCRAMLKTDDCDKKQIGKELSKCYSLLKDEHVVEIEKDLESLDSPESQEALKNLAIFFFGEKAVKFHENKTNIEKMKLEVKEKQSLVDKLNAEVKTALNNTKITEIRALLLEKVFAEFKLQNITQEQCYILVKLVDPNAPTEIDMYGKNLVEAQLEKMKQENKSLKAKADVAEATARMTIDDIEKIRNKP